MLAVVAWGNLEQKLTPHMKMYSKTVIDQLWEMKKQDVSVCNCYHRSHSFMSSLDVNRCIQ